MIIFGAQGYALATYKAYSLLYPELEMVCFMVSDIGYNKRSLEGIPVKEVSEVAEEFHDDVSDIEILIATPEDVQPEVIKLLEKYGFIRYKRLTYELWSELMVSYHSIIKKFIALRSLSLPDRAPIKLCSYVARFYKDKPVKSVRIDKLTHFVDIQVGALLSQEYVADIRDDIGENISHKNPNYSELTGLYWVWKHVLSVGRDADYIGFMQYRRVFDLTEDDMRRIAGNDINVVLPFPLMYDPDINAHHKRYLKDLDWQALLQALRELQPEYADAFTAVLSQQYFYNYNVIIAKRDVLKDYCEWLFPILHRVEELSDPKGWERADRYIGYMAESLETLYFMKNKDRLKIAHTGVKMLV